MSTTITFNGASFTIPAIADASWGTNIKNYLVAIASGALQKTGGAFTLTGEVDFGGSYGLASLYVKSKTASPAATGVLRLSKTDSVAWRNNANSADLALGIDSSDRLTFGGVVIPSTALGSTNQVLGMNNAGTAQEYKTIAGTANRVTVTHSAGGITLSGPQDLHSGASPTFATVTANLTGNASGTAANITGVAAILNGGTGQTTANAALNALLPTQTSNAGKLLSTDGSNTSWASAASSTLNSQYTDIGNASNVRTATSTALLGRITAKTATASVTCTSAAPGVFTWTSHGLTSADTFYFTGTAPTGLAQNTTYYVTVIDANTFKVSTSIANYIAGTFVTTSSTGSGLTGFAGGFAPVAGTIMGGDLAATMSGAKTWSSLQTFSSGINLGGTTLSNYVEQDVTSGVSWGNLTGVPATYTFKLTRVGRVVTCSFKIASATVTGSGSVTATSAVPAAYQPGTSTWFYPGLMAGSATNPTAVCVTSGGVIQFYKTAAAGNWAAADTFITNAGTDYVTLVWTV